MSEEEKKAIEHFKNYPINWELTYEVNKMAIETILNLIEKQQEQLQEKDKIIYEMADLLQDNLNFSPLNGMSKDELVEYFTKKARKV